MSRMNWLITGDWHLGVRGDAKVYQDIFKNWVTDFLVPTIKAENVQTLVVLGDIFDNRNTINVLTENLGLWAFYYITSECDYLQTYLLVGNHDSYFKNTREVHSLKKLQSNNIFIIKDPYSEHWGSRVIDFIPWVVDQEEADRVFKRKGDICLGHFPFTGFEMTKGIVETKGYSLDLLKKNYYKVLSGHFHLRNDVYVGNPFQMSWADTEDQKGVTILNVETMNMKFIPNTISPIYKKVYLSQLKNKTVSMDIFKNNFIKIYLDDKYTDKTLEKLQEVVMSKGPLTFTFEGLSDEDINIDVAVNDLTNPMESLMTWLGKIELKKGVERNKLIEKMNSLYTTSI